MPITVVTRGGEALSAILSRLVALKARAVVVDGPLTLATVGSDRGTLEAALGIARAAGLPVLAEDAGDANLYPPCGTAPCLDGLLVSDPMLSEQVPLASRIAGSSFDACAHALPTVPLALAALADPGWHPPWKEPACLTGVPARMPPTDPCARPWGSVGADRLLGGEGPALCQPVEGAVAGHVVLISAADAPVLLRAGATMALPHSDLMAALGWSLMVADREVP